MAISGCTMHPEQGQLSRQAEIRAFQKRWKSEKELYSA